MGKLRKPLPVLWAPRCGKLTNFSVEFVGKKIRGVKNPKVREVTQLPPMSSPKSTTSASSLVRQWIFVIAKNFEIWKWEAQKLQTSNSRKLRPGPKRVASESQLRGIWGTLILQVGNSMTRSSQKYRYKRHMKLPAKEIHPVRQPDCVFC